VSATCWCWCWERVGATRHNIHAPTSAIHHPPPTQEWTPPRITIPLVLRICEPADPQIHQELAIWSTIRSDTRASLGLDLDLDLAALHAATRETQEVRSPAPPPDRPSSACFSSSIRALIRGALYGFWDLGISGSLDLGRMYYPRLLQDAQAKSKKASVYAIRVIS
jgi:hypothetical protein